MVWDGRYIFTFGGTSSYGKHKRHGVMNSFKYEMATDTWTVLANMHSPRGCLLYTSDAADE